MSQSSGNSPVDRVVAWVKGLFGSGQPSSTGSQTTTTPSATERAATTISGTGTAMTEPSSTITQQVDRANDAMRDSARDLARPLEDDAAGDASVAATTAGNGSDTAPAAGEPATTATPDAVPTANATTTSTQARVDEINNDLRDKARNLVRPLDTEPDADLAGTSDLPGDMGEAATAAADGQPTGASSDEFAGGGYTPEPVTAADVESAAEGDASLTGNDGVNVDQDSAVDESAAPGAGSTPVEATRIDTAGEGTYAATAGDIVSDGPSSEDDLGLVDDGDLDATERGALEDAEDAQLANLPGNERPVFGSRTGADFSRTGFHAGMRGDEADAFVAGSTDAPTRYEPTTTAAGAGEAMTSSASSSTAGDSDTQAASAPDSTGQDGDLPASGLAAGPSDVEDPGNTGMTAGDDYSAERAAEELPGAAQVSTAAADTGQEMASGQEVGDLVGGAPVSDPPAGVAVSAEPTDEVSTGSLDYAGSVRGDGTADTPAGYPIKGNGSSKIYHTPDMPSYQGTKPDWCFATAEDAEQAGFRPPRRYQTDGDA